MCSELILLLATLCAVSEAATVETNISTPYIYTGKWFRVGFFVNTATLTDASATITGYTSSGRHNFQTTLMIKKEPYQLTSSCFIQEETSATLDLPNPYTSTQRNGQNVLYLVLMFDGTWLTTKDQNEKMFQVECSTIPEDVAYITLKRSGSEVVDFLDFVECYSG